VGEPKEHYSADFFINYQLEKGENIITIDDQLKWLKEELQLSEKQ